MAELAAIATTNCGVRQLVKVEARRILRWIDGLALDIEANDGIKPVLVRNDHLVVGRNHDIKFQHVDPKGQSVQEGRQGIFGAQTAATTVAMHFGAWGR